MLYGDTESFLTGALDSPPVGVSGQLRLARAKGRVGASGQSVVATTNSSCQTGQAARGVCTVPTREGRRQGGLNSKFVCGPCEKSDSSLFLKKSFVAYIRVLRT